MNQQLAALQSAHGVTRRTALTALCDRVGAAFGEAGAELGNAIREHGGIPLLLSLVADPEPAVHQQALHCLGNLCSDSVDPHSALTKRALLECDGATVLMACAFSDDPDVLLPACGALQNVCCDREWAQLVVHHRVDARLEDLAASEDLMVVRYVRPAHRPTLGPSPPSPSSTHTADRCAAGGGRADQHRAGSAIAPTQ